MSITEQLLSLMNRYGVDSIAELSAIMLGGNK